MQLYLLVSPARNVDVKIDPALFSVIFCAILFFQVSRARLIRWQADICKMFVFNKLSNIAHKFECL